MLLPLLWVCLATVVDAQEQAMTPCQRCCAAGGDCSRAFKGTPGKCCGTIDGRAFCCPGVLDGAKCFNCEFGYRCFTGVSARNVCGGHNTHLRSVHRHDEYPNGGESSTGMMLILGVAVVLSAIFCARRQNDYVDPYYGVPMGKPQVAYGQPMACCGPPMPMHGHPCGMCGGGYSGTAVAGSAAAGFLGGMLVSDAMNAHHHHHHASDYGDVGYADAGGGGYDGGGGDGGFAADS